MSQIVLLRVLLCALLFSLELSELPKMGGGGLFKPLLKRHEIVHVDDFILSTFPRTLAYSVIK
jgi:hypothetical protein